MKELGEYLKEVRVNNGVELDEAAIDLKMDVSELENIEDGNIRAFKDVLSMKNRIRDYSKYLGLEPEKVIDEFNDFLFEHTSKINLKDILEAESMKTNTDNKIHSPYTQVRVQKISKKRLFYFLVGLFSIIFIGFLVFWIMKPKSPVIDTELKGIFRRSDIYELTK